MEKQEHQNNHLDEKRKLSLIGGAGTVVFAVLLIGLKGYAYYRTESTAVLSSLVDSVQDIVVSFLNVAAMVYAVQPADHEHRYGHGKMEGVAALFQGAFIFAMGVFLAVESAERIFFSYEPVREHMLAMQVMAVSIVLTIILVAFQRYIARRSGSLAMEADSAHYTSDVAMGLAVIGALAADYWMGWHWADPAVAVFVAGYLIWLARDIAIKALDMLLDRELPDADRQKILKVIKSHDEVKGVHDLRTRMLGLHAHISFDIEVDPDQKLVEAHDIALEIEREILDLFPDAEIMIHVDPIGEPEDSRHTVAGVHV